MARTARLAEIPSIGTLNREAGQLSRQLADALREAVRKGDLRPGDALPSTRLLAASLEVARGTVLEAYEQLMAEGFLEAKRGAGTQVAQALAEPRRPRATRAARPKKVRTALPEPAAAFARIAQAFRPLPPVPFAISVPIGQTAPADIWRRLGNRVRSKGPGAPAGYTDPLGALPLREAIASYVRKSRSVHCEPGQIIVTSGTQQGLFLSSQVLLGPRDQVWIENPAYRGVTAIFETRGHPDAIIRVPVDAEGIDVNAGIAMAPHARAAFVTPSHQYPLGMPMSMARRSALLAWARGNDAWIVEDDYDSELRYQGYPFPSLQGLQPDRVVYLGTFSKILFPSLRLGYAIVPEDLVDAFVGARVLMDRHPPNADQHVLAAFIAEGHLERHVRKVRYVYADHRMRLMETLDALLPKDVAWVEPGDQGMHLVLWLAPGLDDRKVAELAGEAGVSVRAVSPMFAPGTARPGLFLGFGGFSHAQMKLAAQRLAAVIAGAAGPIERKRATTRIPARRNAPSRQQGRSLD
ncbi:PLP-dependent aminotransferase family protein [Trinickia caryophylli]|uniref:Transcriptional regulator, GntR family n=1 Tax=Trinickia caryophylli TaxID=28094 RepID=A0A1X7FPE0_TRICW|nr:PLP-dependent aminotransferase family protein [Trinickia caryophylli]PMS09535.1 PLP-dependent aminotransferase family protein [Trinickia caryophylli]TRX14426.1 PLP-dependent aminotransferase family protein [Trinickia caryophylli]WQE14263.1 PLP-dependent aminotransferase family protein [Trinickia caryophylli]SMF56207.1 transcriptional regulator, GntR family [Trinickia caryophylli]GLU33226.1 GntR family transcriptional regulator [Trinickia caryophylli]